MTKKRKSKADLRREILETAAKISANGGKPLHPPKPKRGFQYLDTKGFEDIIRRIKSNPPPMPRHEQKTFDFFDEVQKLPTYEQKTFDFFDEVQKLPTYDDGIRY